MPLPPVAPVNWTVPPTVIDGLVLAVLVPSVASVAVIVCEPVAPKVTLKTWVPEASAAFGGRVAAKSVEVMATTSLAVGMRFQFASTALTVTLKAPPKFWLSGVPVFPEADPAAAVSPGTSNCSLANAPELTVTDGLVFPGIAA